MDQHHSRPPRGGIGILRAHLAAAVGQPLLPVPVEAAGAPVGKSGIIPCRVTRVAVPVAPQLPKIPNPALAGAGCGYSELTEPRKGDSQDFIQRCGVSTQLCWKSPDIPIPGGGEGSGALLQGKRRGEKRRNARAELEFPLPGLGARARPRAPRGSLGSFQQHLRRKNTAGAPDDASPRIPCRNRERSSALTFGKARGGIKPRPAQANTDLPNQEREKPQRNFSSC